MVTLYHYTTKECAGLIKAGGIKAGWLEVSPNINSSFQVVSLTAEISPYKMLRKSLENGKPRTGENLRKIGRAHV